MKKLLISALALVSVSTFAASLPEVCTNIPRRESDIHKGSEEYARGQTLDVVFIYDEAARDLYSAIDGLEFNYADNEDVTIKSRGQIECYKNDQIEANTNKICANYGCFLGVTQKLKN